MRAPLCECFWSYQGEGPWAGAPTLFVRTARCPLRCTYCDSVHSYEERPDFEVRDADGGVLDRLPNPAVAGELLARPWSAPRGPGPWLALTGGEPTLWPDFGRELLAEARARGFRTMLETAALAASPLVALLPHVDCLSMDWKAPSTLHGREDLAAVHRTCLGEARERGVGTVVKFVVTATASTAELDACLDAIDATGGEAVLVLQPVTPCLDEPAAPARDLLLGLARHALDRGADLRLLPQVHRHLGLA
ncbi:MAG: radical SAM protein [Planctomycetota bacterium]